MPNTHVTNFAHQLDMRQVKYEDQGGIVTKADKVDHFVFQIYDCNLSKAKL